jgi:membrane-associated protein
VDWLTDWIIGFASDRNHPIGLALLFGSALVEYVFPPFPGDTITLLGAVLITGYGWSWAAVSVAVIAGSLAGAMMDYAVGRKLRHRPRHPGHEKRYAALDRLVRGFERHGALYLVINRFLPGIRALFFVAAGMAGMPARQVLFWGGLSVALWNGAIIGLGAALGANLPALERTVKQYTFAAWIAVGAAAAAYLAWRLIARRRRRLRAAGPPS